MSCNGCRVLRKGCGEHCSIRPCLDWIVDPEAQANATIFLAKFYGRVGLINLIDAGPQHLRPATFRSLLYEACGRLVNPVSGSVGLLWAGSWHLCQSSVDSVLGGAPTPQIAADPELDGPPLQEACDIRHLINKDAQVSRPGDPKRARAHHGLLSPAMKPRKKGCPRRKKAEKGRGSASHESSVSHQPREGEGEDSAWAGNIEDEGLRALHLAGEDRVGLELTLGLEPFKGCLQKGKEKGRVSN